VCLLVCTHEVELKSLALQFSNILKTVIDVPQTVEHVVMKFTIPLAACLLSHSVV